MESGRLLDRLTELATEAINTALGVVAEPDLRPTTDARFGDYQINGVLPLARTLRDNPRVLAAKVLDALDLDAYCDEPEIAGPGFINLRLKSEWLAARVGHLAAAETLGLVPATVPQRIVVDFSSPNVAKRMHVGHLRSTIIGDALVRSLKLLGHKVVGDNHVGDWGTQFGILIWAWKQDANEEALAEDPIGELERLYKLGTARGKEDPAIAAACRAELVSLQAGDATNQALWERFVAISRADAELTYERLAVSFDEWRGESCYHDALPGLIEDLKARGIARESEGAIVVFFAEDSSLSDKPFLVQKSDGAFLYGTTDLATIAYRREAHDADRMIYVVDVRQSLHFEQLFATAQMMGHDAVSFEHVGFGMMLGADGKPSTRATRVI